MKHDREPIYPTDEELARRKKARHDGVGDSGPDEAVSSFYLGLAEEDHVLGARVRRREAKLTARIRTGSQKKRVYEQDSFVGTELRLEKINPQEDERVVIRQQVKQIIDFPEMPAHALRQTREQFENFEKFVFDRDIFGVVKAYRTEIKSSTNSQISDDLTLRMGYVARTVKKVEQLGFKDKKIWETLNRRLEMYRKGEYLDDPWDFEN